MKYIITSLFLVLILVLNNSQCHASWLIYHKPEFKGKVINAETKEPIEGAVVVVVYRKSILYITQNIFEIGTSLIKANETLTDKNGEFIIPSYTTAIQPFSAGGNALFIIYKPGYGNYPTSQVSPRGISPEGVETFFSKKIGSTGDLEVWSKDEKGYQFKMSKFIFGVVELPKLMTKEERLNDLPSPVSNIDYKEQNLFIQLLNQERKNLGLDQYKVEK